MGLTIIFILMVGVILLSMSVIVLWLKHAKKDAKHKKCTDGPAFWCGSKSNWGLCVDDTRKHSYDDYCCKDVKTWMGRTGTKDPDPNTNGFDEHCK